MEIVAICGSRSPKGQTARAVASLLEGAKEAGAQTDVLYLPQMRIERCRQCDDAGWGLCRSEGRCVVQDDFAAITARIAAAGAVVFATPVYWGDLSESLRALLDRLRRTTVFPAAKERYMNKPAIGVCVAGGGGGGAPNCCVQLEKVLHTIGLNVLDMVPVRRQNLDGKVQVLRATGRCLAAQT